MGTIWAGAFFDELNAREAELERLAALQASANIVVRETRASVTGSRFASDRSTVPFRNRQTCSSGCAIADVAKRAARR